MRRQQHYGGVGRGADTTTTPAQPQRSQPAPQRPATPTGVFARPVGGQPLAGQQRQQATRTQRVATRLPAPPVAAPPVIRHPTRAQTNAAARQISSSLTRAVGTTGTNAERIARRDAIVARVRTDPQLAHIKTSWTHWGTEQAKLVTPEAAYKTAVDRVKPGKAPTKVKVGVGPVNFGTVNVTAATRAVTAAAEKVAPGLKSGSPEAQFAGNALKDIAHLPLMVPQTAYEVAAAAKEAAGGDTRRAKALAKGLTQGVYGHLAHGDVQGALEYFRKHPVYAILELRGGKGFAGRGAGAAMRSGAFGEAAAKLASTKRADIPLSGEGARVADRQHYSPDVLTKLFQMAVEKKRGEGATVLGDHRLRRRADLESDMAASSSRAARQEEGHLAHEAKPKGPLDEVVGLAVQGVVRPTSLKADLEKELARLDEAHATARFSTVTQRDQNRATAGAIRKVLADPRAMARIGDVAQSARANVRGINELEGKAVRQEALSPGAAERAKLFPAAQAHLGAEYSDAPFRAARDREIAAARAVRERVATATGTMRSAQERVSELVGRHRSERGREAHHGPVAAYYVGDQRFTLRQDAVAHAKDAGVPLREVRRVAITSGEAQRVGEIAKARRAYKAARNEVRSLKTRGQNAHPLVRAFLDAQAERKAAMKGGTRSLNLHGEYLPNEQIRAAIGEPVAHLPHHTQARGARAYYQTAFAGRKNLDSGKRRTGAAFEKGAVDSSYKAVTEHRVRLRGVVNRISEHDRIIHSISITGPKTKANPGGLMTWDQAERISENARGRGSRLVPYRAVPGSYDKERVARIAAGQDPADGPALAELVGTDFAERLKEPAAADRSARNVVLVPEQIVNQLKEQQKNGSSLGMAGNVAVDVFRRTVLPFSTKWLVGNVAEAGVRLAAVGAGINAHRIGKNLLAELDKIDHDQALRVKASLTGGLLYGNKGLTVRRFHEHFEGSALEKPAAVIGAAGQIPPVHLLGKAIKGFTDGVFTLNRAIEGASQKAALGKFAKREMQEMTGSWAKATRAQEAALQDIARGLMDSKNIHDAARYIDQTLGQYSRFSPQMRRFIQSAAPFLPWYLNSVRFVFWTLPAKHPIKSGLMALTANNLQADFDASHKDLPPGDLHGDIVTGSGSVLPFARYTPFGAFGSVLGGGNEQLIALIDPIFPQFKGAALAAFGLNFAGHQAKIDPADRTQGQAVPVAVRASMAFNSLLEAFVPVAGIGRHIREGGKTGWDNSTLWAPKTKPGTSVGGGAARRILDPFRPVAGIKGGSARPAPVATPAAAASAQAPDLEDSLTNNLYQSLGDAQQQQALEDSLVQNLYGG